VRFELGIICGHFGWVVEIPARTAGGGGVVVAMAAAGAPHRSKDRFLAVLSHELRTPLTPVLMTVAARQNDPELSPDVREDIDMIRRNVELETKLIDDLLDLSRITSGKLRLNPQAVDLNDAVRHVCGICRGQILEKGIRLECTFDAQACEVTADPARLQQVLWNVIKNAAKFTAEGGEIQVMTERLGHDRATVRVRDNGAGIAPQMLPRIFDAFEQGSPGVTRQFGGLGLGLAISKALIELHAGAIRAQSDGVGKGSVFTIELPMRVPAPHLQPRKSDDGTARDSSKLRLLVVEDHPDTAAILSKLLNAAGYSVKTANSAANALSMAATEAFDLLISDIGLPDATGYELMQQLRRQYAMRGIAMSGYGMDDDIRRSRDAGFAEHLVKPINLTQLHDAIKRLAVTR
jgi:CheY-like chemotaxis protein